MRIVMMVVRGFIALYDDALREDGSTTEVDSILRAIFSRQSPEAFKSLAHLAAVNSSRGDASFGEKAVAKKIVSNRC